MAEFPQNFPKAVDRNLINVNFTDLAEGTGIVRFYLVSKDDGTYFLTTNAVYSSLTFININSSNGTYTFDTSEFVSARRIRGTAYFNMGVSAYSGTNGQVKVKIQKYDGTTATDISSEITSKNSSTGAKDTFFLSIPVTDTIIKKGEQIRLLVTGNNGSNTLAGISPSGVWETYGTSDPGQPDFLASSIYIPFDL